MLQGNAASHVTVGNKKKGALKSKKLPLVLAVIFVYGYS